MTQSNFLKIIWSIRNSRIFSGVAIQVQFRLVCRKKIKPFLFVPERNTLKLDEHSKDERLAGKVGRRKRCCHTAADKITEGMRAEEEEEEEEEEKIDRDVVDG